MNELRKASYNGDLETVKILLENGADINVKNDALYWSAYNGNLETTIYLIKNGEICSPYGEELIIKAFDYSTKMFEMFIY